MGEAVASQVLALELEKVRPNLSLMYQQDDTLWSEFKPKTDVEVVSGRPTRVPMELLAGAKFRVADPDGGDLGLGSGPTTDVGTLTPVYFFQCTQYTKSTEINTNQKQKAIESYAELVMKRAMEQFNTNMEAAIQGDGSNTLDSLLHRLPARRSLSAMPTSSMTTRTSMFGMPSAGQSVARQRFSP
jgi:hypothetical protein